MEHALICPQCKAPLTPHRFAKQATCAYCGTVVRLDEGTVSTKTFRDAYLHWNSPASYAFASTTTVGDRHWAVEDLIAQGESSDIFTGRLARWPTELVLIKVLRDEQHKVSFEQEWKTLEFLQKSEATGAETFLRLIPQPVVHGIAQGGAFAGKSVSIFRWASGFQHTFEAVRKAYPQGIAPRASIWVWRRILEVLAFLHASGAAHGAVLPEHLLVQENDHGVRLVGYGRAGRLTEKLEIIEGQGDGFYPQFARSLPKLSAPLDLVMSARCIVYLLGGDPSTAALPPEVPALLASLIQKTALAKPDDLMTTNAWSIHQELGSIAAQAFGPASFHPIVMPKTMID